MKMFICFFFSIVDLFYACYLVISMTVLVCSAAVGVREMKSVSIKASSERTPDVPVSIIVPAHNEEMSVVMTVKSLLELDYRNYEIIVVDDGSTDETSLRLIKEFEMNYIDFKMQKEIACIDAEQVYRATGQKTIITLIKKANAGKADALNLGINAAQYAYFLCVDADSILEKDSLARMMAVMKDDEQTVAVGGSVFPGNIVRCSLASKLLVGMQSFEYLRAFLASRVLFDRLKSVFIISGAIGLFRKDIVVNAGGYDTACIGEDMEIVMKLHKYCISKKIPYRIRHITDAVCKTKVPTGYRALFHQRKRWSIGLAQCLKKYKCFLNPGKYGMLAITYLYIYVFEKSAPNIELFGILTMILTRAMKYLREPFLFLILGCTLLRILMAILLIFVNCSAHGIRIKVKKFCLYLLTCIFESVVLHTCITCVRILGISNCRRRMIW